MSGVLAGALRGAIVRMRATVVPGCGLGAWLLLGSQPAEAAAGGQLGGFAIAGSPLVAGAGPLVAGRALGPSGPTGFATPYADSYSCGYPYRPCDLGKLSSVSCATATNCIAVGTAAGETLAEGWDGTSWNIDPTPAPTGATYSSTLQGVSCKAVTACLAVGSYYDSTSGEAPLAETSNGSSWTIRPPPAPSNATSTYLDYVQCASASACMAVGYYYAAGSFEGLPSPLAEFWDGSNWTIQTVALPSGALGGQLNGVSCPSATSCAAVGGYWVNPSPGSYRVELMTLAEFWNGTSWSIQTTPNPTGSNGATFSADWCESPTSCTAVGNYDTGSGSATLAESWDGTSWTIQSTPNPTGSTNSIFANISCAPSGTPCEAVGLSDSGLLAESWDGTNWTIQPAPAPANSSRASFSDVSCTSATACTAVGQYTNNADAGSYGADLTLAERWDGSSWLVQHTQDPPAPDGGTATNITLSSATLNGAVNPNGATVTNCHFEYGTTSAFGSSVPCAQSVGAGGSSVAVSADVSGLAPNTTYYYTVVATNAGGSVGYNPESQFPHFTTTGGGGSGPSATTGSASNPTSSSATLTGSVNPNGATVTSCYFEYGQTTSYGSSVLCDQTVGSGTSSVAVSATPSGLTPATTYHFELVVVTNGSGTVYGGDQSFATSGISAPDVTTGTVFTDWGPPTGPLGGPASALATGTINPHGRSLTYEFFWDVHPVAVFSGSDLANYSHATGPQTLSAATTAVQVSMSLPYPGRELPYWVRLAAFDGQRWWWGAEVPFEVTPPTPEAHAAPYLSVVGGTDAGQGYTVYCLPGRWDGANTFATQWVYVLAGGATEELHGNAVSDDQYHVSKADSGHALACVVTPYEYDGTLQPDLRLQSDVLIPEGSGTPILASFLKAAIDGADAGLFTYGQLFDKETGLACILVALQPEVFGPICLRTLLEEAITTVFADVLKEAVDPLDRHYNQIALPQEPGAAGRLPRICPSQLSGRACRTLTTRARAYEIAAGRGAALLEALAVSRNRTLVARRKHDSQADMTQAAARKVYFGLLVTALVQQRQASLAYANVLRYDHLDIRITAEVLRRVARRSVTSIYGRALIARLRSHGFTLTEIDRALAPRRIRITSFDLQSYLRKPVLPLAFARYYNTIDLTDLMTLVTGLASQHALQASTVPQLFADLDRARAACTQTLRASAIQYFLKDATSHLQATYNSFLTSAAQPLIDGASTVDPFPRCIS